MKPKPKKRNLKRVASRPGFGDDRGPRTRKFVTQKRESFRAECSQCGNGCTVPFKPHFGKPVLCSNCFGGKQDRPQERRSFGKPAHRERAPGVEVEKQLREMSKKIDLILDVLNGLGNKIK